MRVLQRISAVFFLLLFFSLLVGQGSRSQATAANDQDLPVFATEALRGFPLLMEQMAGRRAFLLGDASHGTHEYYAFRKLVTRHLIRDHGVRLFILEAEWDGARMIDDFIGDRLPPQLDARTMLARAFVRWPEWVWANEEIVEFVQWLKLFNQSLPEGEKVRCYGMDMQLAVRASLDFLATQWPSDSPPGNSLRRLRQWWDPYIDDPLLFNKAYAGGRESGSLLATELLGRITEPSLAVVNRVTMLMAAEEYYRIMSHDQYEAWNIRSRYFADYVTRMLDTAAGNRGVVVWAHNSHVGDMSSTEVGDSGLLSFGQLMRERLGTDEVFILGSAGYEGTVLAAPTWNMEVQEMEVPPTPPGSFEAVMNSGGWPNPLLLWRTDEERRLWSQPMLHRGIGVSYAVEEELGVNYLVSRMSERYDAIVFWRKTRALRPLYLP